MSSLRSTSFILKDYLIFPHDFSWLVSSYVESQSVLMDIIVLFCYFCQLDTTHLPHERISVGNIFTRLAYRHICGALSQLFIYVEGSTPLWEAPSLDRWLWEMQER